MSLKVWEKKHIMKRDLIIFCCMLTVFFSCTHQQKAVKLAENTSQQSLLSGNFQKAIDVCIEIYKKYRQDNQSQKCLVTAARELVRKGNTSYNNGEYAEAGKIYYVLKENAEIFKMGKISAKPDIKTINIKLENCSTQLNRKGIELYREGNLRNALVVWKDILEFDPDNDEVRRAVNTTSAQIKNMQ